MVHKICLLGNLIYFIQDYQYEINFSKLLGISFSSQLKFSPIYFFTSVNSMSLREKASWLLLGKIR